MVKLDSNVAAIIKKIEGAGYTAYAAGPCVRKAYQGVKTPYWDVLTDAPSDKVAELFTEGEAEEGVVTVFGKYIDEKGNEYEDGLSVEISTIRNTLEKDLAKYDFTIDAVADNPARNFVDPYGGLDDLKDKMIATIGSSNEMFATRPETMLQAILLVGETGGKLSKEAYFALKEHNRLIMNLDAGIRRDYLENIMISDHTGEALALIYKLKLMFIVYGDEVAKQLSGSDKKDFEILYQNIDKTYKIASRRIGNLYSFLSTGKTLTSIKEMGYEEPLLTNLRDVALDYVGMHFLNNPTQFKKFLFEHGEKRYNYLHNLAKANLQIFGHQQTRIESRNWYMQTIKTNNEPVYLEDLVIDANDLMEAGIARNVDHANEILANVMASVHKNPANNRRELLLREAKKMARNSLAAKLRYVNWIR